MVNIDKLSSGCKTALNIYYYQEKIFSLKGCGDNALNVIYSFERGSVHCEYPIISFEMEKALVRDRGLIKEMSSYEELKEWWENDIIF